MRLVISDQHSGLVAALKRAFQGTAHNAVGWHFARNLLALVPKTHTDMVAAVFRTIVALPDPKAVAATWDRSPRPARRFPKIGALMDGAKTEVLAFTAFPRAHWPKSGAPTRSSGSTRKSSAEPGSWASSPTTPRSSGLVGAILADMRDEWQSGERRYLSEASMAQLKPTSDTGTIVAIDSGE